MQLSYQNIEGNAELQVVAKSTQGDVEDES